MVISHSYVSLPEGRQLEKSEVWMLITFHPMRADILIKHTVTPFKYVEGGPDREAPEVV